MNRATFFLGFSTRKISYQSTYSEICAFDLYDGTL